MEFPAHYLPPRRTGLIFHASLVAILWVSGGFSLWYALQQTVEQTIIGWLLFSLLLLAPTPFILYRGYALMHARYILDRDGLRIRWGLRSEDIPMPGIEWIRPANELGYRLRMPLFRWPGSLYGRRSTEGLGVVEFIASETSTLHLIATPDKVYALSPIDSRGFLNDFRHAVELGSLAPIPSTSILPTTFLKRVWSDSLARLLIFTGIGFTGLLVLMTSALIASNPLLPLGYDPLGRTIPPGPSQYVLLLPILGSASFFFDLLLGLFFYRRQDGTQVLAYLLWAAGILIPILLLIAVYMLAI